MDFTSLIRWAKRFQGFLGFAAFIILVLLAGVTYLFSQGSFDQLLSNFGRLAPGQFLSVVYLVLGLPFIIIILLIILGYRSARSQPTHLGEDIMYVQVYDSGTKARLAEITVYWNYRGSKEERTDKSGEARFAFPVAWRGETATIEVSGQGYETKSRKVKLGSTADVRFELSRTRVDRSIITPPVERTPIPSTPLSSDADTSGSGNSSTEQNIRPRYFHYISKQKVQMLLKQIRPSTSFTDEEIIPNLQSLIDLLEKNHQLQSLADGSKLATKQFIRDMGTWHHGLFEFRTMMNDSIVTYLSCKAFDDYVVILVGSPNNILGERLVKEGVFVPGTSGAYYEIIDFVGNLIKTDEPRAVTTRPIPDYARAHLSRGSDLPEPIDGTIDFEKDSRAIYPGSAGVFRGEWGSRGSEQVRAAALLGFWSENLRNLAESSIDTVFKIFSKFELGTATNKQEHWGESEVLEKARRLHQGRYKTVYVGSPLYIALD
jgi:hypothetical protein